MAELETQSQASSTTTLSGSLLDDILNETKIAPRDEGYDIAKKGIELFITEMLKPQHAQEQVDRSIVDSMIAEIDSKLSKQVDAILHHEDFQKMESAWRSLKFVIDRTDFRENIEVEILNCSKEKLFEDLTGCPEITKTGLYKIAYTKEYGQHGGKPYGAIFANFSVGPGSQDIKLLQKCAAISAMAHAPFFAAAGPQFFGLDDYQGVPNLKDIKSIMEGPTYAKWQSFRESEDARNVGLVMPRFLLRLPYGEKNVPAKTFGYEEDVVGKHDSYLWGNAVFAMATRIADSFAKYRWCPNIIGPQAGGTVADLPLHYYESLGEVQAKIPTEVLVSDRREFELSEEGFIPLTYRKDSDSACFFSANSCQKPKFYGQSAEGKTAEMNYRLGTQLPYMFVVTRIAHYLKVLQREQLGSYKERIDLEKQLNTWIDQYVVDQDGVSAAVRGKKPLRNAQVVVSDVPGNAGWYKVDINVRPHFKYMGANFTLSLVGKLDKDK